MIDWVRTFQRHVCVLWQMMATLDNMQTVTFKPTLLFSSYFYYSFMYYFLIICL